MHWAQYDKFLTSTEVTEHCKFSRIRLEKTTRKEIAMAVEIMTVLLERG